MLFTYLEKTKRGRVHLAPFDWEKHSYLKKYDSVSYSLSVYESLIAHYPIYSSVVTEICLVDKSAHIWSQCLHCSEEKEKMIKLGQWTEEDLKIVIADCERYLDERFKKAIEEKDLRAQQQYAPVRTYSSYIPKDSKFKLHKPMYYKGGE